MNDPLPTQLTVGELRKLIENAPDSTVIALQLPPSAHGEHQLTLFCNLTAKYDSGPIVLLAPLSDDDVRVVAGSSDNLDRVPASFKCALYWLLSDLTKGLLEDERWDFDSDWFFNGRLDWDRYTAAILDPTVMGTVISVWTNNLAVDASDVISNPLHARFRAIQYFRTQFDDDYSFDKIEPPLAAWELREWQTDDAEQ